MVEYVGDLFEAMNMADYFRILICRRVGCKPDEIKCPREQSAITPCIARDGSNAVAAAIGGAVCVGCERQVVGLLEQEKGKASS